MTFAQCFCPVHRNPDRNALLTLFIRFCGSIHMFAEEIPSCSWYRLYVTERFSEYSMQDFKTMHQVVITFTCKNDMLSKNPMQSDQIKHFFNKICLPPVVDLANILYRNSIQMEVKTHVNGLPWKENPENTFRSVSELRYTGKPTWYCTKLEYRVFIQPLRK